MNREYIKQLIAAGYKQWKDDPQNEIIWEDITKKIFAELSKDLEETITYIDVCLMDELYYISQVFEELSEHFKSQELINCVERNIVRFPNPELQEQLKSELEYMKMYV